MVGGVSAQSQDELMKKTATIATSYPCGSEATGQSENQRRRPRLISVSLLAELSYGRA